MAVQILAATLSRSPADPAEAEGELTPTRLRLSAGPAILRQFLAGPVSLDRVVETVERPPAEDLL